ncbi:hypothetical protein [Pseudomonas phage Ppu-503]|nr:hypothetical protein [Pseudomonas phage Ppu-503]
MKPLTAYANLEADRLKALARPEPELPTVDDWASTMATAPLWDEKALADRPVEPYRYQKDMIAAMQADDARRWPMGLVMPRIGVEGFVRALTSIRRFNEQMAKMDWSGIDLTATASTTGRIPRAIPGCTCWLCRGQSIRDADDTADYTDVSRKLFYTDFSKVEARVISMLPKWAMPYSGRRFFVLDEVTPMSDVREKQRAHDTMQRRGGGKGEKARQRKFRNQFTK